MNYSEFINYAVSLFHDRGLYHYGNQSIDLHSKSMDWFLCDRNFRHERTKKHVFVCLGNYRMKTKHGIMVVESVLTILKLDKL